MDRGCSLPSDNASWGPANCNVVTNDKKFDLVRLVCVLGSELFLRQTEVGDISSVVSKPVVSRREGDDGLRRCT